MVRMVLTSFEQDITGASARIVLCFARLREVADAGCGPGAERLLAEAIKEWAEAKLKAMGEEV